MNTQTFAHTQAFTAINDEELQAAAGGATYGMTFPAWPLTPNSSVPSGFLGSSSGTPGLGDGPSPSSDSLAGLG